MAFQCFVGSFVANTSTGQQAITGVGFQPKAVIFQVVRHTAAGGTQTLAWSFGCATAADEEWVCAVVDEDTADPTVTDADMREDACILMLLDGGAEDAKAVFISKDADGFTVDWINAPASALIVQFQVLGGSDVTNVKADTFAVTSGGTGTQAVTGVGFQPDCMLFVHSGRSAFNTGAEARMGIGAATSATSRFSVRGSSEDNQATTDTFRDWDSDHIIDIPTSTGANDGSADLDSFNADGFTIDIDDAFTAAFHIGFLAFKGGQYFVHDYAKSGAGAPVDQALTGIGFPPVGSLHVSHGSADLTEPTGWETDIGFSDGVNDRGVWISSRDARGSGDVRTILTTTKFFSDGSQSTGAESWGATMKSFDSDGYTFTLDPNVANTFKLNALLFGSDAVVGGSLVPPRRINTLLRM